MTLRIAFVSSVLAVLTVMVLSIPIASGSSSAKYTVTAVDFKFRNVPARVTAGAHTFTLVNRGSNKHDLKLAGKKTKLLNKGQRASITVSLKKGRTYAYLCTVPGHAALGMKGKVVVR
jgi:plastocyanin